MAGSKITAIYLDTITERSGILGRKTTEEELLRLMMAGGSVVLRESAVTGAGDSWRLMKRRLWNLSKDHSIPFEDRRPNHE